MTDLAKIVESLSLLTVLEASKLSKMLEETWDVTASAPMMSMGVLPAAAAAVVEEKTDFDVWLMAFGEKKLDVIKQVRSVTDLGLKEAKDLVEAAPKLVKAGISKEESAKIKLELEKAGATVELK